MEVFPTEGSVSVMVVWLLEVWIYLSVDTKEECVYWMCW